MPPGAGSASVRAIARGRGYNARAMSAERSSFFDSPRRKGSDGNAAKAQAERAGSDRAASPIGRDVTEEFVSPPGAAPMSVSALVSRIRNALAEAFPQRVCVVGEISNLKLHGSGHLYFRLKDANAAIDAAMWRSAASRLKFRPTDGMEVVAEGRVDVYDVRGQLQLYVERLTPRGQGALELAFRQLYERLQREGLFDPSHKIPLPRFPRAVGLVTSPTGAAVRDMVRTLRRRWPAARVYLVPVLVQGEGAAEDIARGVRLLDASASRFGIDTIIVGRGGGSVEDLWAFNEEVVARAIYACNTPIVSGVGHEVDTTIADLVADVRAATPTGAAELAVPDAVEVRRHAAQLAARLERIVRDTLRSSRAGLEAILRSVVFRDPAARIRSQTQRLDELEHRLGAGLRQLVATRRRRLEPAGNRLAALHPARLAERARGRLEKGVARLAWVLGALSKRSGDRLAVLEARLGEAHPRHRLALAQQKIAAAGRQLESMSYRSVLRRGYSVTRGPGGEIARSVEAVAEGDGIETELVDGRIDSTVTGKRNEAPNDRSDTGKVPNPRTSHPARRPMRKSEDRDPTLF